jgi:hypothetical protein
MRVGPLSQRFGTAKGVSAAGRLCLSTLAAAALAAAGCGAPSSDKTNGAAGGQDLSQAMHASFDKSFNEAFAKSTHDSCVSSSTTHGATADQAERYCTCVVGQLAPLTVQEKQQLSPSSDKFAQIRDLCRAQVH